MNIFDYFLDAEPGLPFVVEPTGRIWTYGEVGQQVSELLKQGPEDNPSRLLWRPENSFDSLITLLSSWAVEKSLIAIPPHFSREQIEPFENLDAPEGSEAIIVFTSGSLGEVKGVSLSFNSLIAGATASNETTGLAPSDCWYLGLPMYHIAGIAIVVRSILARASLFLAPKFSVPELASLAEHQKVTSVSLVTPQLSAILQSPEYLSSYSKLRFILYGGSGLPKELRPKLLASPLPVLLSYGMSEAGSTVAILPREKFSKKLGSSGMPLSGMMVKVVDGQGSELSCGEEGEIVLESDALASGYLIGRDFVEIEQPFMTGDRGFIDEDGYLFITGRQNRRYVSGGENVSANEVEEVARAFDGVIEAAIVVAEDSHWGESAHLFVEIEHDRVIRILSDYYKTHFPAFKRPVSICKLTKLPRTGLGKIDYRALAGLLEGGGIQS